MENTGEIYVFSGPMFSGKTKHVVENLLSYDEFDAVKPDMDDRYSLTEIVSHDGDCVTAKAVPVDDVYGAIKDMELDKLQALGIDEAQFFDNELVDAVSYAADRGVDVYVAGLDTDFRREGFHPVPELRSIADHDVSLYSDCSVCGEDAEYSQRLLDGEPARYDDPVVDVGAEEKYEPRCRKHHEVRPPEEDSAGYFTETAPGFSGS